MFEDAWSAISGFVGDTISDAIEKILNLTIFRLLYFIEIAICRIVNMLNQMFEVFAGLTKVSYNGEHDYLINVFFGNQAINNVYWGMALIGIVLTFGFAIASVVKKMFDLSGKQQQSLGQIIMAGLRSMFLILGLTAVMTIVMSGMGVLMQQVNYLFTDPGSLDLPAERTFTSEEYAAMGRAMSAIGNHALSPTYNNRYNINDCFNEIRSDLYYLQEQGVFRYYYPTEDSRGDPTNSWQSVLQSIVNSHDLRSDLKADVYYEGVSRSIVDAMELLRTDASIRPLESISRTFLESGNAPLDRLLFLMGTMRAAKNSAFNEHPALNDALRGPYYYDKGKSIYDIDNVDADFDIGFPTDYIVVYVAATAIVVDLAIIILNCIARIFNMLFLYIIAPPIIAARPLDGGGKLKQWLTAFLVQSLSVFGTVISMRLLLIYIPIIAGPELVLFENSPILNLMGKLVLLYGGFEAAKKSTGLFTGILADSAGWQAIQAGDMSSSAGKAIGAVTGAVKGAAGAGLKVAGAVGGFAASPVKNLASRAWNATGGRWSDLGKQSEKSKYLETKSNHEQWDKEYDAQKAAANKPEAKKESPAQPNYSAQASRAQSTESPRGSRDYVASEHNTLRDSMRERMGSVDLKGDTVGGNRDDSGVGSNRRPRLDLNAGGKGSVMPSRGGGNNRQNGQQGGQNAQPEQRRRSGSFDAGGGDRKAQPPAGGAKEAPERGASSAMRSRFGMDERPEIPLPRNNHGNDA